MHINDLHNLHGLISQSMNWNLPISIYYASYFCIYVICFTAYQMVQLCFRDYLTMLF